MSNEAMESVNVKLPPSVRDDMMALAKANERTFAAEVRIAIRSHLQSNGPAAPSEQGKGSRAATEGA